MKWFGGSVEDAVAAAKQNNCFFVVFVESQDKSSEIMDSALNSEIISSVLDSDRYINIRVKVNSEAYNHFVNIYKHVPAPCLFLIGLNGEPIAVISNSFGEDIESLRKHISKTLLMKEHSTDSLAVLSRENIAQVRPSVKADTLLESVASDVTNYEKSEDISMPEEISIKDSFNCLEQTILRIAQTEKKYPFVDDTDAITEQPNEIEVSEIKESNSQNKLEEPIKINETNSQNMSEEITKTNENDSHNKLDENIEINESISQNMSEEVTKTNENDSHNKPNENIEVNESNSQNRPEEITKINESESHNKLDEIIESDAQLKEIIKMNEHSQHKRNYEDPKFQEFQVEKVRIELDRQRILNDIAIDKQERILRQQDIGPSPINPSNNISATRIRTESSILAETETRIQFRKPDGSVCTEVFNRTDLLDDLRLYVVDNVHIDSRRFKLATPFPRHVFTDEESCKSLEELHLVPNAVIIIIPSSEDNDTITNIFSGISYVICYITYPFVYWYQSIKYSIFGPQRQISDGILRRPVSRSNSSQAGSSGRRRPLHPGTSNQGNVHTMRNISQDSDKDKNNVWNGNSTQQFQ